jgi:2-iminobutanoate/2-iminopropanoate deaminase
MSARSAGDGWQMLRSHSPPDHHKGDRVPRKIIRTANAPVAPPSYSQAVAAAGLIFVSGQGPFDPASGEVVGITIQEQTAQCLRNVAAILKAAGSSLESVLSATFILAEEQDFAGFNEEWIRWFLKSRPLARARNYLSARKE